MIIDNIRNISLYKELVPGLEKGLEAIEDNDNGIGRYEFDGGFFMVQAGKTKPMDEGFFEAHRKYVDIQIVLEGSEEIAWADLPDLKEEIAYNPEKDALYLSGNIMHNMKVSKGMFYIAFPHDGHKAVRHTEKQQEFKKIVIKLPTE
ncbi:YhcH/YjgK/YiaL family protein [Dethiosulfatibacter aminovorans DSM 17477]|uniref:YhcH/YjgK/YiaL family protein n=1 Tax=Dethiosulfatibacter aminovorans DSM 17477 TaxID=1121476 RepID=A0A1M6C6G4_9FIRM|nr:YhcH/YjgK/YiaL family protein [Dethiosulfatibacter aminovorans]SHI56620.1 YhcH/YjgK/YiaL family protein [Dethiosulfatibacter aminovorans DSM 17477]